VKIRPVLQIFAHSIGAAFRILPRKKRYAAARRLALAIAPLLRRSPYYARRPSLLDGSREEALRIVLRTMTRARVTFDPDVEIIGRELLPDGACLIVGAHFLLNIAMTRWIFDDGRRYTGIVGGPREPVYYFGTTEPLTFRYPGPQILVQLRRELVAGNICFVALDMLSPAGGDWTVFDTAVGARYVSPAAILFAQRIGTPVVFAATYVNPEGRIMVTYERPQSDDPAAMTAEFCRFLQRHIAAVER
jgi:hypothetical protein